jgi:threonine synthase
LTCWGGNVAAYSVHGAFDDCQRLVKTALADKRLSEEADISSANSINIGRLLPQMTYFAKASFDSRRRGFGVANFVIPSGNLGHATACVWAREIGCPIGEIVLAHNANRTMVDYLRTGEWRARATLPTLASAMDVGDPSNAERLRFMFGDVARARSAVTACSIGDDAIRDAISRAYEVHGRILCPHSAAALEGLRHRRASSRAAKGRWVVVATADASKFPEIVAPVIGRAPPLNASLAALPPSRGAREIGADYEGFFRTIA